MRMIGLLAPVFLFTTISALPALADGTGKIVIIGHGMASSPPEFARIRVEVTSICYDTSREAKDANAILANEILALLQNFANDDGKVVATGGVNTRRTETIYLGDKPKILCEMKWRATNTLILETSDLELLADIQDGVLAQVDATATDPNKTAQTFAELDQPSFHLRDESMQQLKVKAHQAAYGDAKVQFDAFQTQCNFVDAKLASIEPPEYSVYGRKDGDMIAVSDSTTPIVPDDIAVSATWRFKWTFTPTTQCPM